MNYYLLIIFTWQAEAKSHCVATSLKQAMDFAPELAKKITVIEDCMSDVPGLGYLGEPVFCRSKKEGSSVCKK